MYGQAINSLITNFKIFDSKMLDFLSCNFKIGSNIDVEIKLYLSSGREWVNINFVV